MPTRSDLAKKIAECLQGWHMASANHFLNNNGSDQIVVKMPSGQVFNVIITRSRESKPTHPPAGTFSL